ncbi:MAG: cytochrome d ubiquinol oxidase subunit II [Chloroflexota bacterium]|jgi:cytochrome d ubiquinol oxidase subunit II|nr:cytochrome d ubiquinol oxidase subunit II [Chloroflexota bacterium]
MSPADVVVVILWIGLTLYAVLGGADFGAGFWDLLAGGTERGRPARALIDDAIGPVWETNHTWLIFDLVILWTAFPVAFASVMSSLYVPLIGAAFGIVLRGSGFAFRRALAFHAGERLFGSIFALASIITPFFLGAALGAIASGRVPIGNAAGDPLASWLTPTSVAIGALAAAGGAYLAGVYLVADARRQGDATLEGYFRRRALASGMVTGGLAITGIFVLQADAPYLFNGLITRGLPLVVLSVLCGSATLLLLLRGSVYRARVLAAGAVASIVVGWGIAQYPYLLPTSLTVAAGAAPAGTLDAIVVIAGVALLLIAPSLAFLLFLAQRNRLSSAVSDQEAPA